MDSLIDPTFLSKKDYHACDINYIVHLLWEDLNMNYKIV